MNKLFIILFILLSFSFLLFSKVFADGIWFSTNKPNCQVWNPDPESEETALWSGSCLNGKAHGEGAITWRYKKNGNFVLRLIEGEMKDGRRLGEVRITYENGSIYIGKLNNNGNRHGQGKYTYANGTIEEGIFKDGKFMYAKKPTSTSNSKIEGYKSFCSEIGFTPGTEKFGECVVDAMKKG